MSTASQPEPTLADADEITTAVIRGVVDMGELAAFFDASFSRLAPAITAQGVAIVGPAFALYHGPPGAVADMVASRLPGGRVAALVREGSFDQLGSSWRRLAAWIAEAGLRPGDDLW